MKISTKGEYGIRAMLYLAQHPGEGAVTSHEIARHQGIPEPYLRQILAQLSKTGLILSNRGPQGGHLLARPADEITIRDVILPLEGQTTSVDQILALHCTIEVGAEHCAIRELLLSVKRAVDGILTATTLADLAHRQAVLVRDCAWVGDGCGGLPDHLPPTLSPPRAPRGEASWSGRGRHRPALTGPGR